MISRFCTKTVSEAIKTYRHLFIRSSVTSYLVIFDTIVYLCAAFEYIDKLIERNRVPRNVRIIKVEVVTAIEGILR